MLYSSLLLVYTLCSLKLHTFLISKFLQVRLGFTGSSAVSQGCNQSVSWAEFSLVLGIFSQGNSVVGRTQILAAVGWKPLARSGPPSPFSIHTRLFASLRPAREALYLKEGIRSFQRLI